MLHVIRNVVKLCSRNFPEKILPFVTAIVGQHNAPIISIDDVSTVSRINPECMVVSMLCIRLLVCGTHGGKSLSSISRFGQGHTHDVNYVLVVGIYPDLSKHPSIGSRKAFKFVVFCAYFFPILSLVFTPVHLYTKWNHLDGPAIRVKLTRLGVTLGRMIVNISIHNIGLAF